MIEVSIRLTFVHNYFGENWAIILSQEFELDLQSQIDDKLVTIEKFTYSYVHY